MGKCKVCIGIQPCHQNWIRNCTECIRNQPCHQGQTRKCKICIGNQICHQDTTRKYKVCIGNPFSSLKMEMRIFLTAISLQVLGNSKKNLSVKKMIAAIEKKQ